MALHGPTGVRAAARRGAHALLRQAHRSSRLSRPRPAAIRNVLVSGYTGLGHMVLRSVLIAQVEELYPGATVTVIAGNSYGTEHVFHRRPVLVLPQDAGLFRKLRFFARLRRRRFDAALLTFDATPRFLIWGCLIAGIPIRIGHVAGAAVPDYYFTTCVALRRGGPRSEIDLNLDLLEALRGSPFERRYDPVVDLDEDTDVLGRYGLKGGEYITVQIGAANGLPTPKRWLPGYFRELLLRLLAEHPSLEIVALGDRGDLPLVERVCGGIETRRLKVVAGRIGVPETKALIARCRFLVCHDSGLLHLGNALGASVLALYGPSDPDVYTRRLATCHILQERCDCPRLGLFPGAESPDEARAAARCPAPECMRRLTVNRVFDACTALLNGRPQAAARDAAAHHPASSCSEGLA
jgi:ADP-heptose:LPS heptosyltransferase